MTVVAKKANEAAATQAPKPMKAVKKQKKPAAGPASKAMN